MFGREQAPRPPDLTTLLNEQLAWLPLRAQRTYRGEFRREAAAITYPQVRRIAWSPILTSASNAPVSCPSTWVGSPPVAPKNGPSGMARAEVVPASARPPLTGHR